MVDLQSTTRLTARRLAHHREPLEPEPPKRSLGWLPLVTERRARTRWRPWLLSGLIAVTIGLGTWGFRTLAFTHRLSLLQSVYHAARLYALEIGPADGSGTPGVGPNWQVLLALALAAALGLGVLLALAGGVARRLVTRRVLSGHVIVCGAGVHGSHLARELCRKHDVVLVDPEAGAPGMRGAPDWHEWRIVADAVDPDTLAIAGARRASWLVAVAGDDYTNSQIVSALLALGGLRDGMQAIVQIEDPALARFLEDGERPERALVTPFSPNAIAADALLDGAHRKLADGQRRLLLELEDGFAPYLILAGDHPLLEAIVLAALRHWRVRTLREREQPSGASHPPMRIGLYGARASARAERLTRIWRPEPDVLELEARDVELAGGISVADARWLAQRDHAAHAFVACERELDGVELSLALSRALGAYVLMTRVTTQRPSLLDARIQERTAADPRRAPTTVRAIDELAYDRDAIAGVAASERLVRALEGELGEPAARAVGTELLARRALGIHSNPMWRVLPSEETLARPLIAPAPISALLSAGLSIELRTAENLRAAAEALAHEQRPLEAFSAWCEYARLLTTAGAPGEPAPAAGAPAAGDELADELLRLRTLTLGLPASVPNGATPAKAHRERPTALSGARRVAIFAGAADPMTTQCQTLLEGMLSEALDGYDGIVLSRGGEQGLPGLVGTIARKLELRTIGYAPSGGEAHELQPTPREALAMWSDILDAGVRFENVRVVACPGGPLTTADLLLARALGASVAWIDPASETLATLDDELPFGAGGVLELPDDAMTLRAFLSWSSAPEDMPCRLRDGIARYLHADYRRRQRARKQPGDAALAPWEQLLPALQRSNLAQAGDIPNKLAAIGKRLAEPHEAGEPLELSDTQVELLAEIEHGRWNLERLRGGWQLGVRDVSRLLSSYLKPWGELDEEAKGFDREAVRNIAPALADAGWQVRDAEP
jgi:TrkA-N domain/RyR domain